VLKLFSTAIIKATTLFYYFSILFYRLIVFIKLTEHKSYMIVYLIDF